jgi:hypothetical protein
MDPHSLNIEMAVTVDDDDEISGQVSDGAHPGRPFSGWVGLIGVLDELLGRPHPTGPDPPP